MTDPQIPAALADPGEPGDDITITVTLNGTDTNRWKRWGLMANPFPQAAIAAFTKAEQQINSLDGDTIRTAADIRERLEGFADEFVDLCVSQFRRGQRVAFLVTFPRSRGGSS